MTVEWVGQVGGAGIAVDLAEQCDAPHVREIALLSGQHVVNGTRVWVAKEGVEVVGFAATRAVADGLHLANLATRPNYRRRGVGKALVRYVLEQAQRERAGHVRLEVRRSNRAAIGLYRTHGFTAVRIKPNYYDNGEDAIEMRASASRTAVEWLGLVGVVGERPIVLIGDSLAVGLSGPLKAELTGESFYAFAKGGTAVSQWLSGSQSGELTKALALQPRLVLVSLGTNDTNSKVPADKLKAQVANLVSKIRDSGAEPVWLMPGKLPWPYPELTAAVDAGGVRKIEQPVEVKKPLDGIHPSGESYKVWAAAIVQSLKGAGAGVSAGAGVGLGALIIVAGVVIVVATLAVRGR